MCNLGRTLNQQFAAEADHVMSLKACLMKKVLVDLIRNNYKLEQKLSQTIILNERNKQAVAKSKLARRF